MNRILQSAGNFSKYVSAKGVIKLFYAGKLLLPVWGRRAIGKKYVLDSLIMKVTKHKAKKELHHLLPFLK